MSQEGITLLEKGEDYLIESIGNTLLEDSRQGEKGKKIPQRRGETAATGRPYHDQVASSEYPVVEKEKPGEEKRSNTRRKKGPSTSAKKASQERMGSEKKAWQS